MTTMLNDNGVTFADGSVMNSASQLGFRNKIINGDMRIAQRGTSFPATVNGAFTLDRWVLGGAGTDAVIGVSQAGGNSGGEFGYSLSASVSIADSSIAAGQSLSIQHRIEGYNVFDLVGKTFTLSFWVYSAKAGTHCVSFTNSVADRSFVSEYTVSAPLTWEKKTVTVFGGLVTTGTWNWSNGIGLGVRFALAAGSSAQTTPNTWQAGNFSATTNQVNCLDTVGNIFAITGVQLEVGAVATPFEHRPYGQELALCQRYLPAFIAPGSASFMGTGYSYTTIDVLIGFSFKVTPRVAPTGITVSSPAHFNVGNGGGFQSVPTAVALTFSSLDSAALNFSASGHTAGQGAYARSNSTSAKILFEGCEL